MRYSKFSMHQIPDLIYIKSYQIYVYIAQVQRTKVTNFNDLKLNLFKYWDPFGIKCNLVFHSYQTTPDFVCYWTWITLLFSGSLKTMGYNKKET